MAIMRWSPMKEFLDISERMNRLFGDLPAAASDQNLMTAAWAPKVDIFQQGDDVVIQAELPGLAKADVTVNVQDGTLSIKGERKFHNEVAEGDYYRMERSYGAFQRSFVLPADLDPEKIRAAFKDGVLTVTVPKAEQAKPKSVDIDVN